MEVEELAPHVCPAGRLSESAGLIQLIESGVAIGLQNAAEATQMLARVLALAIGRVAKQHRSVPAAAPGPLIAHVSPQPPGLGLARSGCQHRHRRVVGVQRACA
jgi:hypothetical protein